MAFNSNYNDHMGRYIILIVLIIVTLTSYLYWHEKHDKESLTPPGYVWIGRIQPSGNVLVQNVKTNELKIIKDSNLPW